MVEIKYLQEFARQAKALRRKYKSFEVDYNNFLDSIERNPFQGTSLGAGVYKVRMQITSKRTREKEKAEVQEF